MRRDLASERIRHVNMSGCQGARVARGWAKKCRAAEVQLSKCVASLHSSNLIASSHLSQHTKHTTIVLRVHETL